ncbi:hypothetical protein HDU97_008616 [Phlyctochytrium planicorne]|nr:hypothetical protein HDU97_008616 [Phlyctochytrium planicorne]
MEAHAKETEFDIASADWVLIFQTKGVKQSAIDAWEPLITRLLSVGLHVKVRELARNNAASGTKVTGTKLAIFIHCPDQLLHRLVFKSRVTDWISHVGEVNVDPPVAPETISAEANTSFGDILDLPDFSKEDAKVRITPADRLRLIHELIVSPTYEGGAGVNVGQPTNLKFNETVGNGHVEALFALHDNEFCDKWLRSWSRKWFLGFDDISMIRENMGERIGFYFAFMQFYLKSLLPISVVSLIFYFFFPSYSRAYALLLILWSATFVVLWKREAMLLSHLWGTLNQAAAAATRPEFQPDVIHVDAVTGERVPYYPEWKRLLARTFLTLPIVLAFTALISIVSLGILVVEVFVSEYYDGPLKEYLAMLPVLLYVACIPILSSWYQKVAVKLTDIENPSTKENYDRTLSSMSFILSSLLTHLSILLVGFVFIPVSDLLANVFRAFGISVSTAAEEALRMGPDTLRARVVYFSLTAQIINQFTEVGMPLIMQWVQRKTSQTNTNAYKKDVVTGTAKDAEVLKRVREELERPPYDLYEDYAEMANQFGLIVMFSGAWNLVPVVCLVNNFIEMRSDALKICKATRRSNPERADNINPWMDIMALMSLFGSITSAAFVLLYENWESDASASSQLMDRLPWIITASLCAEHIYLFLNRVFETIFGVAGLSTTSTHPHQHVNIKEGDILVAPPTQGSATSNKATIHRRSSVSTRSVPVPPAASNVEFLKALTWGGSLSLIDKWTSSFFAGVTSTIRTRQRRIRFDAGRKRLALAGIDIGAGRHGGVVKWRGRYARGASQSILNADTSLGSVPEDSVSTSSSMDGGQRVSVLEDLHPGKAVMYGLALQAIHEAVKDE